MKYRIVLLGFLSIFLFWQACDEIEAPYKIPTSGGIVDPGEVKKVILIEEFTGQRCPNCPVMAERIKTLKSSYEDQIVVVAIHAGFYAMPIGGAFSTDYRTPAGNELDQFFGIGQLGYPKGLVNRSGYQTGNFRLESEELAGRVAELVEGDPVLDVKISRSYSESNRTVSIDVNTNIREQIQRRLMLSVFITEDGIVSPQQDKTEIVHDYVHQYILRTSANGTWGDQLSDGSQLDPGASFNQNYQVSLSANWNDENCYIVAFVYDGDTFEVLQAAEARIR